ncbi:MAG TPA: ABC transporter permease [Gemmatimonadales bacterium]|nr:ABC transporter permease [Gemmatimonadales bacterium]
MIAWFQDLYRRRDLFYMITWREIVIRYKQSVMGFLWAILMPLLIVGAGIVVRAAFAYVAGTKLVMSDLADVSVRAVPWAFFVAATRFATNSLIGNVSLVQKIYMPREIFPLAAVAANFVDFLVASVALTIFLVVVGTGFSVQLLWVPLLVLILVVFTIALGTLLSAASLFFRDVKYLVEVFLTFAIFITPVFFSVNTFARFRTVLLLNPVSPLLEGLAQAIAHNKAPLLPWVGYSAGVSLVLLVIALLVFKHLEPFFAESI